MIFLLLAATALLAVIAAVMIHNALALRRLHRRLDARARLEQLSRAPDDDGGGRRATEPVLRVIKGGATLVVGAAAVTIAWTREHPAAAFVALAGAVATTAFVAASSPFGAGPDTGSPMAAPPEPPPALTVTPSQPPPATTSVPAPAALPSTTMSAQPPRAATPSAANSDRATGEPPPALVVTRTTTAQPHPAPPGTSPPQPTATTPAPKPPAPAPCGIDVNLRPIINLCVL
ncbi:hypothetical protein ACFORO_12240 [Amycolatopsis halotolerans]|uniref:Uncharacterized protein n=1 Tax=Amycolatopsis halotolerans TaxID=330083 RepID=A0ABV7QG41_9PSEU